MPELVCAADDLRWLDERRKGVTATDITAITGLYVAITVTCDLGHIIGVWTDKIEEKYPFWCDECDEDKRADKYPWVITAEICETDEARDARAEQAFESRYGRRVDGFADNA